MAPGDEHADPVRAKPAKFQPPATRTRVSDQQRGPEGFDRKVAVKRILPHLAETADFVRMFLSEARLAARLSHPNIVHIYELGQVGGDYFIAMEYVDGIHAGQLITHAERERLPPELVARIGADAAAALAYAHRLEDADGTPLALVHRDVSPHNLMVSFDGVTKLVDFGIAKVAQADDAAPGQAQPKTSTDVVMGTPRYMAPEQCKGGVQIDDKADVYSLGVMLYEMLSGSLPFRAEQSFDYMALHARSKAPSLLVQAPWVASEVALLVEEGDLADLGPLKTLLAVAHVRKRTRGPVCLVNTHPFARELWGRQFVFAHNGTVKNVRRLKLGRFQPIGTTDSEYAFCALLGAIAGDFKAYPRAPSALAEAIAEHGARIGVGGTFNFLLGDGSQLVARCSTRLHHIVRQAPFARATLADEDVSVDFAAVTTPRDRVAVVATVPLTKDERWIAATPGTTWVFRKGRLAATFGD